MANSDEKISKFVQAITEYAEEQRQKIHQEVEDFKAERLKQAEKEVLVDAYRLIQKEQTELRSNMSREMSLGEGGPAEIAGPPQGDDRRHLLQRPAEAG